MNTIAQNSPKPKTPSPDTSIDWNSMALLRMAALTIARFDGCGLIRDRENGSSQE